MANKLSNKIIAIVSAIAIVVGLMTSVVAFAGTGPTVNATSSVITSRIVISEQEDIETDPRARECFAEPENPGTINLEEAFTKYYISVEPDAITGGRITSIKINDVSKDIAFPTGRNVYEVPAADVYSVEVEGVQEQHYNIMWANDGAKVAGTDYDKPDVLLKNGSAKVIKVYDNETDMHDISNTIEHIDEGCLDPEGKGYIELSEGNVVVFEFTPKYGYQLTSVSANGTKLKAQETINQYKYVMPATNIHFQATFTKTSDVVKSATSKVTSGTVKVGLNEIDAGTTVLSVKDATITDEQKSVFASKAGDYNVSNILDIKLDQVFYKGSTDSSDVWSNSLGKDEELKSPAVITLKLDEGVDGNTVVLIHEKKDGTYETIDTTYDAAAHTITFSTTSFSNYAIASKTVVGPKTGDSNSLYVFLLLGLAAAAEAVVLAMRRRKEN